MNFQHSTGDNQGEMENFSNEVGGQFFGSSSDDGGFAAFSMPDDSSSANFGGDAFNIMDSCT
jgi:hypothetical protein